MVGAAQPPVRNSGPSILSFHPFPFPPTSFSVLPPPSRPVFHHFPHLHLVANSISTSPPANLTLSFRSYSPFIHILSTIIVWGQFLILGVQACGRFLFPSLIFLSSSQPLVKYAFYISASLLFFLFFFSPPCCFFLSLKPGSSLSFSLSFLPSPQRHEGNASKLPSLLESPRDHGKRLLFPPPARFSTMGRASREKYLSLSPF